MKYIAFGIFILCSIFAQAQQDTVLDEQNVTAESVFKAKLTTFKRLSLKARLPEIDTTVQQLNYQVIDRQVALNFEPPRFPVLSIRKDPVPEKYNGYARIGYGTPNFLLGEGSYYRNFLDDALRVGLEGSHFSADNTANVLHQENSETNIGLNGTYYLQEGMTLDARAGYGLEKVKYYGIEEPTDFEGSNFDQDFSRLHSRIKFYNGELTGGDLNYQAELGFKSVKDNFATKEQVYDGKIGLGKYFNEKHLLDVKAGGEITRYDDTSSQRLDYYFVEPTFTYHADKFYVKGGVNILFHDDTQTYIPEAEALASILGEQITAFAGFTGGIYQNNFNNLSETNPFINSRQRITNSLFRDAYGGFKGAYRKANYQLKVGYKWVDNLALFEHNPADYRNFLVTYDDAQILYFTATADVQVFDKLNVIFSLHQNNFSLDREEKAWHLPTFEMNTTAIYTMLEDKLKLQTELFLINPINYRTLDGRSERTNAMFDLNLRADYWLFENIGAFLSLNNIANNRFERWNNYQNYGFNLQGGVKARF